MTKIDDDYIREIVKEEIQKALSVVIPHMASVADVECAIIAAQMAQNRTKLPS